jgi:heat shock protein HslJ
MLCQFNLRRCLTIPILLALIAFSLDCQSNKSRDDESSAQAKPASIEDTTWQLIEIGGKSAEPAPADARAANFRLNSSDKHVSGYSGVNQFKGGYQLDGYSLKFSPLAMTRRAGPEPLMKQESAFTEALTNAASWRVAGDNNIQLLDSTGKSLAKFRRGPMSE